MNPRLAALHDAGGDPPRARHAIQHRPAYGTFVCKDGRALTGAALEDHFWQALVRTLPLPAYASLAYAHYPARAAAAVGINAAIAVALGRETCQVALQRLASADVPVAEVVALDELATVSALADSGLFVDTAAGRLLRFPVPLMGVSATTAERPAP